MLQERFDDFDEFAGSVAGVESTMTLQNPERRSWTLAAADVGGVRVQYGTLGSGNIVEGRARVDGSVIYLPLSENCTYSACGVYLPKNGFMILEAACEFTFATKYAHDWCSIFIPNDGLNPDRDVDERPDASRGTCCRVTRSDARLAARLRTSVQSVLGAAVGYPEFESSVAAGVVSADLLELGATILGAPKPDENHVGRPKIPREEIIRRARELLEEREHEHLSVADLVAAVGVSERTLRAAFNESFGAGPKQYLILRALRQVKRALETADPDRTSVSAVLAQYGQWEFSRFARRYRRLFGEYPSETLRRERG
jgi:AraC family ethanolamine operon transcriptional activator